MAMLITGGRIVTAVNFLGAKFRWSRLIQSKSLQALRDLPTMPALDAVRALDLVFREERGVAGKA